MTGSFSVEIVNTDQRFSWRLIDVHGQSAATCWSFSHASAIACRACLSSTVTLAPRAATRSLAQSPGSWGWCLQWGQVTLARSLHLYGTPDEAVAEGRIAVAELQAAYRRTPGLRKTAT
jgi:hypothetical protein